MKRSIEELLERTSLERLEERVIIWTSIRLLYILLISSFATNYNSDLGMYECIKSMLARIGVNALRCVFPCVLLADVHACRMLAGVECMLPKHMSVPLSTRQFSTWIRVFLGVDVPFREIQAKFVVTFGACQ